MRGKTKEERHQLLFFLGVSLIITCMVWGIFAAQKLNYDVVSFSKNGDAARQTYPAFIQLGWQLREGIRDGVDILITNGANSIHSDGVEWYFIYRLFAWIGAVIDQPMLLFGAFYALHMFLCMFFTQCLCYRIFGLKTRVTILISVSVAAAGLWNSWFTGFYVIYSLVLPLCYFTICAVKGKSTAILLVSSLAYYVAFNSGYSLLSCCLAAAVFLFTVAFCAFDTWELSRDKRNVWRIIVRAAIPAAIGFFAFLPRFVVMFLSSTTSAGVQSITDLNSALDSGVSISAWPYLFFFSSVSISAEGGYITIGLVWLFFFVSICVTKAFHKDCDRNRFLCCGIIIATALAYFISIGKSFPFGIWFYEIPYIGLMHLRQRFLLILLPMFYLALGIGLNKLSFTKISESLISCIITVLIVACALLLYKGKFDRDYLPWEIGISAITILCFVRENAISRKAMILAALYVLTFHCNRFYDLQEVKISSESLAARSIAFDSKQQIKMDSFVDRLADKALYKYVGMDEGNTVPIYTLNNYGWYHQQRYDLCNYLKYSLHGGAVTDSYRTALDIKWFNWFDWEYLFDTRGDFVVLQQERIDRNPDLYARVIDSDSGIASMQLSSGYLAAPMRKYIPRHYTNGARVEDSAADTLDNGYFYSPVVAKDDVVSFQTDKASYFSIDFFAGSDGDVQFSMAPVPQYRYYLDGEEIEPTVDYYLCYIPVTAGEHTIEVRYFNRSMEIIRASFEAYHLLVLAGLAFYPFEKYYLRRNKSKKMPTNSEKTGMPTFRSGMNRTKKRRAD